MTALLASPTSSSAKLTLTKAKGPAPYALHDLILIPVTSPEIIQQTWTNNMEEWAKGVPLEQYHAREQHLAATAFSSENHLITWILVPKADADVTEEYKTATGNHGVRGGFNPKDFSKKNLERILGAVETYERPGIVATIGDEALREVSSVSVASVYAPSKYRNHGYGKLMMRLLWKEIEDMGASFSFLYSDLGPDFYGNFGWTARTSTEIVILPSLTLPAPPSMASSAMTTRASARTVELETVTEESLAVLIEHDAQLLRTQLTEKLKERSNTAGSERTTFVAVTPEVRCIQWLHARAWFNAKEIWKFQDPQIKDLRLGVYVTGTKDQFVLWHHDFTDDNLFILRWRIDSTTTSDESDTIALAFVEAAQQEAKKWRLSKIVFWNGHVSLANLLGLKVQHRHHSIPSLGLVKSDQDTNNIAWVLNEKYSWC
ncbi:hypothetical protein KVV02_004326 [Mortierella alpina]|uniref:LYC1 C-terminal domain-containing protein n=1 Tax=Mortierella alpina TaxID=64518 RepID=A0A9P8A522_MORAP|nr:hypothetical protein KVV02_004326 [Mortierella alpina]